MKFSSILPIIAAFGLVLFSCDLIEDRIIPSGKITIREESLSGYNKVDVSGAFTVYVTFSDTEESIKVEANDNLQDYIEVKKDQDILRIGFTENLNISGSPKLNIYIITSSITDFMASGASRFLVEGLIETDEVGIYLSGASTFKGTMISQKLNAELSGASNLDLEGNTDYCVLNASGASLSGDYEFKINKLNADLSGASKAWFTVLQTIDIKASGASKLQYKGTASITSQDLSGASEVKLEM